MTAPLCPLCGDHHESYQAHRFASKVPPRPVVWSHQCKQCDDKDALITHLRAQLADAAKQASPKPVSRKTAKRKAAKK